MPDKKYDICIIGSGAGAGPIAYELSKEGYSVVILEKGPWIKTEQFTKDEIVAARRDVYNLQSKDEPQVLEWLDEDGAIKYRVNDKGGTSFIKNGSLVGGSSNFMSAYFHRLKPQDFKLLSTYGPIDGANIVDWPISYDDMEPYFDKVEKVVGVSGRIVPHSTLEPRSSAEFPMPPLGENLVSSWIDKACEKNDYMAVPMPRGILSKPLGDRNPCYYSNYCGSYGCASDAKASSRAALLNPALKTGNLKIIPFAKVFYLETDGRGELIKAHYHSKENQDVSIEAKIFVVAAQAIESARLLLMSKNKEFPNGLANNSGQVGKNIIFSGGGMGYGYLEKDSMSEEDFKKIQAPGVFVNRSIQEYYEINDAAFGPKAKGGTVDFLWEHANPIRKAIKAKRDDEGNLLYGSALKEKIAYSFKERRRLNFEIFNDWTPNDNCFIRLDDEVKDKWGDAVARIRFENHPQDEKVGEYIAKKVVTILKDIGAHDVSYHVSGSPPPNLQAGGCRFGKNPQTSVLDPNCKAHEVENLYVTDGSFMPTGGSVPYTWTIYANSFRVADKIIERLKEDQ